jgi:protein phosphatase
LKGEHGPFDIVGDIHGCFDELLQLLNLLGYEKTPSGAYRHAAGRKAVFLGDLVEPRAQDS